MGWFFDQAVNEAIQNFLPDWLEKIFVGITFFGDAIIYILLLALAYWLLNKKDAIVGIYVLITASFLNFFLKVLIKKPRPSESIRIVEAEGFSTPSGHSQTSTTVYGWMMFYFKKIWLYILVPILVLLICFSRVVLGVHFIGDIILGFLIGAVVLSILYFTVPYILQFLDKFSTGMKILIGECYALIIFLATFLPGMLATWPNNDVSNSADLVATLVLFPVLLWIENKWIRMDNDNLIWYSKLLRAVVGIIVLVGSYFGLSALFGLIEIDASLSKLLYFADFLLRFARYTILIAIVGLGMPTLFAKVKIFTKKRELNQQNIDENVSKT